MKWFAFDLGIRLQNDALGLLLILFLVFVVCLAFTVNSVNSKSLTIHAHTYTNSRELKSDGNGSEQIRLFLVCCCFLKRKKKPIKTDIRTKQLRFFVCLFSILFDGCLSSKHKIGMPDQKKGGDLSGRTKRNT